MINNKNCTINGTFSQSTLTYDALLDKAFDSTVELACANGNPPAKAFASLLMSEVRGLEAAVNKAAKHDSRVARIPLDKCLPSMLVGRCMLQYHQVVTIEGEGGTRMLAVYVDDENCTDYGTYVTDEERIRAMAREFNSALTSKETREVIIFLRDVAPSRQLTVERDLLPMANGIFDYRTKETMPFSPDYVYLAKYPITIPDHHIDEPVITMPGGAPWTFTGWLAEVFPDEATREVVWDVLGALLRPHVNWLKIAFLIGSGRNGKGTIIELMRALVGHSNCGALSLKHFAKQTDLVPLLGALANIADENDDSFIPTSELVKAIADHNTITVRQLYHDPFTTRLHLFNVQAMNELPVFKDKSDGMHARILAIPFEKQFLRGRNDNTAIKSEYMVNPDVVQWVAYHALVERPDYYELGASAATDAALVSYRIETDPVAAFWADEVRESVIGCFLPYSFLYAWYTNWLRETNPSGHAVDQRKFTKRIKELAASDGWVGTANKRSCQAWMPKAEPHAERFAKTRYTGSYGSIGYDFNDQLARWFASGNAMPDERGLVLGVVDDWCKAHKTNPRDFVKARIKRPNKGECYSIDPTIGRVGKFVKEVEAGTIDVNTATY